MKPCGVPMVKKRFDGLKSMQKRATKRTGKMPFGKNLKDLDQLVRNSRSNFIEVWQYFQGQKIPSTDELFISMEKGRTRTTARKLKPD